LGFLATPSLHAQRIQLLHPTNTAWKIWTNGTDPGYPEWFQKNFDDSGWPSGTGLFGLETFPYPYPIATVTPPPGVAPRFYARTHFWWNGLPSTAQLFGTNYIDDGAVVYLNGVEILRFNMPAGPTSFSTLAPSAVPEPSIVRFQVYLNALTNGEANPLVAGDNVIAVEVANNSTTSSDTVWGMTLYEYHGDCWPLVSISPAATNQTACRQVTFAATVLPCDDFFPPPVLQWYRNVGSGEEPIVGATGTNLTVSNLSPADNGQYFLRLNSFTAPLETARSSLTVTPDTQGPRIVSVVAPPTPANVWVVTFDEPVQSLGGADEPFTWAIETTGPNPVTLNVTSAVIDANNPAVVRLTTAEPRDWGVSYRYSTLSDIADDCAGQVTPAGLSGSILIETNWYAADDQFLIWRYDDTGTDRGTAWKEFGFDDSQWKSGKGLFDGKDVPRTVVSGLNVGTQLQRRIAGHPMYATQNVPTMYFRTRLNLPFGFAGYLLSFRSVADDGYVMYVNGMEVSRRRVPPGTEGFSSYSSGGTVGDADFEGPITIPTWMLNFGGENVIAVLLKQNDATSSDITWGLEIAASIHGDPAPVDIVQEPASVTVTEGHPFTLSVMVAGTSPSYQWFKGTTPIPGATSSSYSKVATAGDAGDYHVHAFNSISGVDSANATVTVRPVVLLYGTTWKYETNSQDATLSGGTPWYAPAFNDTDWPSGPGLFAAETTAVTLTRLPPIAVQLPAASNYLTAYFRTAVTIPDLATNESLYLSHAIDDGAAVYVDGQLALLYNLDGGPIRSTTPALASAPGDGDAREITIPIALAAGTHTLAVEVHQAAGGNSDVVFGLELSRGPAFPKLRITRPTPTQVELSWIPTPGVRLFEAETMGGTFAPITGNPQGVYSVTLLAGRERYFRLGF
jgi:hypothetical protein